MKSFVDIVEHRAGRRPEAALYTWLDDRGEEAGRLTAGALGRRARALGAWLQAAVPAGEPALLLFPPGLEFVTAFCGCLYAGAVAVPAYPPRGARSLPRLTAIAADARPRAVLTTAALLPRVRAWVAGEPSLAGVAVAAVDEIEDSAAEGWRDPGAGPDALAFLQYTSGSTAEPKGVMVRHGNLLHNEEMIRRAFAQDEESVVVSWLPLYHDMGLIGGVLQPLYSGGRCVLTAPAAFLKRPALWLEAIHRHRATTSGGPNFAYELCVRKVGAEEREGLDLSSWRVAFNGSEPVRPDTLARFAATFASCGFRREALYPCYGLAEATLFVTGGEPGAGAASRAFSAAELEVHRAVPVDGGAAPNASAPNARALTACGRPWMGQRVAVVDPDSRRPLAAGGVGEIWVAGPSVAAGYWNRPQATERDFAARLAGEEAAGREPGERWLRTGDLGFLLGEAGSEELFVTGRLKDLIILRGRNVYPQDVERTAEAAHAAVRPGCTAAFAAEVEGEERLVLACEVDRRAATDADPERLAEVAEAVRWAVFEAHEAPVHEVVLLRTGTLPKTSSGKVRRRACRAAWEEGALAGRIQAAAGEEPAAARGGDGPAAGDAAAASDGPARGAGAGAAQEAPAGATTAPCAELVARLREWAAPLLRTAPERLPVDRPLVALGLDSLGAAELQQAVEDGLGVSLDLGDLLEGASLEEIAGRVAAAQAAGTQRGDGAAEPGGGETAARAPVEPFVAGGDTPDSLPLSHGQRALWFLHRLDPSSAAYHIAAAVRVHGDLDAVALRRALAALGRRHPALATVFEAAGGEPVQRLGAGPLPELRTVDAAGLDSAALERRLREAAYAPFDLAAGPLLRAVHLAGAEGGDLLVLSVHHAVADFWTLATLYPELAALYAAETGGEPAELPAPAASYADWVAWQERRLAGAEGERLWEHWRRALAGAPELDLATDRPRPPVQGDRGGRVVRTLPAAVAEAVGRRAAEAGTTPFVVLLAAFQAVLHRYTGQDDFLLGTPTAGREVPQVRGVAGYFVNPVVLRADAAGDPPFAELLARAGATARAAFDHAAYPFPLLTERLRPVRDPSRSPLFQVLFSFQSAPRGGEALAPFALGTGGARAALGPLALEAVELPEPPAQFDLQLAAAPAQTAGGALGLAAVFNRDLFDRATVERLLGHLDVLLAAALAAPGRRLSDLPLMGEAERRQLVAWNGPSAPLPKARLHQLFEARADAEPDAVAVIFDGRETSYRALDEEANRLARLLLALGAGPEVPVGVLVERSAAMVAALLAVLKTGAAYLPLDPAYPAERVASTLADSGSPVLVTEEPLEERLAGALAGWQGRRLRLDADRGAIAAASPRRLRPREAPAADELATAYLIYTSGSTGRPKGVQVPHRAIVNFLATMAERPGLAADDVLVAVTTLSFDIAALELFLPLAVGARVVVARRETASDGAALARLLEEAGATVLQATPTTWRLLVASGWRGRRGGDGQPPLKALCGGEALPRDLAGELAARVGELWNVYGPTETTVWSAVEPVAAGEEGPVSLGRPIGNTDVHLLDRRFGPVPAGVPGELAIGGEGLARGYLRRAALTADRFVPHPLAGRGAPAGARIYRTGDLARRRGDGRLDFLGRLDHQVKVRGVRIELGEVEAALAAHPAVAQAVAGTREPAPGDVRLVAWVVPAAGERPTADTLRRDLAERLPESYLPSLVVVLDALPLTPNGKVDRKALPEPDGLRPELATAFAAPRSELERTVAALWREVLGVEKVGVDDSFFDLGGHSLLLARVEAGLAERGHRVSMVELFRYPTVSALAAHLAAQGAGGEGDAAPAPAASRRGRARARRAGGGRCEVAIVGLAGRFPGAPDADTLWRRLRDGEECVTHFTAEELAEAGVDRSLLDDPRYVRSAAVLEGADRFDAGFFGYTPREAELMDPQHRVFLECAWQALEDAGYGAGPDGTATRPGRTGVFAGVGLNTYLLHSGLGRGASVAGSYQAFVGNDKDFVPTRVSYELDLKGPSVNVQTACSSSLVAVHLACRSLADGECDLALAGGVTIRMPQREGYLYEEGGIPSPDGRCRPFDARAAGTVFGSGAGVVVLKRLEDALADGDTIRAVVKGSAINNDGAGKMGYTAPSVQGQAEVIAEALAVAGVEPDTVGYVEAHGTGTAMGDPIEVAALTEAFRGGGALQGGCGTDRRGFCALGSVKGNLGHLDTAAGVTGLIKTVLALQHRELPPSLHFESPNPRIDFAGSPFFVAAERTPWTAAGGTPRRAGVSSFGIGGTNAHLVLEEAPAPAPTSPSRPWHLLTLSAKTASALDAASERLAAALGERPGVDLADVAWTLATGRRAFAHRRTVLARDRDEAVAALAGGSEGVRTAVAPGGSVSVAFLFPGQGAQHPGMARGLWEHEPVFRRELAACLELLAPHLGFDLEALLLAEAPDDDAAALMRRTEVAQPALFAVEHALARLWIEWGVAPAALAGHSLGEYVAAVLAGVFTLADAARLVAVRGDLMGALAPGAMLAVDLPEAEVAALLAGEAAGLGLDLAAVNGPAATVVSGAAEGVDELERRLAGRGARHRRLHTSHAFHSRAMEPALERFAAEVAEVERRAPRLPFVSNLTGDWITAEQAVDPGYWARHLREPVRFGEAVAKLATGEDRVLLEVGPGRTLVGLARPQARGSALVASMPHPRDPQPSPACLADAAGRLWLAGVEVDWGARSAGERRRRVPLPPYPFEGKSYLLEARPAHLAVAAEDDAGRKRDLADWFYLPLWREVVPPSAPTSAALAGDWLLLADSAGVAAGLAAALRRAGARVAVAEPGDGFARPGDDLFTVDPAREADYEALLAALASDERLPRRVVHAWSVARGEALRPPAVRAAEAAVWSFGSVLSLARALERHGALAAGRVELTVLANDLHRVAGEPAPCPEKALLLGPVKVLPQEMPGLACRAVEIRLPVEAAAGDPEAEEALTADLLAELAGPSTEPVVAWRDGRRWVESFEPLHLGAPAAAAPAEGEAAGDAPPPLREEGHYLVTGGLGAVGLAVAAELARAARARLTLLGRSGLPERAEWPAYLAAHGEGDPVSRRILRVEALEAAGARVLALTADVTDRRALAAAVERAEAEHGPLHGVVHAAGLAGGGIVQRKSPEQAARVMAPKVAGTLALAEVLAESEERTGRRVDFLLLASSINAVIGGFGQSDYAAANAFCDAFARSASRRRRRVLSLAWDRWRGLGMAADPSGALLAALGGGDLAGAAGDGTGGTASVHPLIDGLVAETPQREVHATAFAPERHWVLAEHRVLAVPTLPGTTYLEMARAAFARRAGERPVEIANVTFLAPLAVADGARRRVLTVLEAGEDAAAGGAAERLAFRVVSEAGGEWVEHARGTIAVAAGDAAPAPRDARELIAACSLRLLDAAAVADPEADRRGPFLVTGPRWQALERIHVGDGEAVAAIALDERFAEEAAAYTLHPSLLDVAAGAVRFLADGDYLPLTYERLVVRGPLPPRCYSHLRLRGPVEGAPETLTCDLAVLDEEGRERVAVTGFSMRRVDAAAAERLAASAAAPADAAAEAAAGSEAEAGMSEREGVETFRRALAGPPVPRLVVSTHDLESAIEHARRLDRDRIAEELARLAPPPARRPRPAGTGEAQAPEGDLERRIAAVWQRVLGIEQVGVHDNFFELGGTSLAGIQLVSELKAELGMEIPTVSIFEAPTVAALAKHLAPGDEASAGERARDRADKKRSALAARRAERRPARAGRR